MRSVLDALKLLSWCDMSLDSESSLTKPGSVHFHTVQVELSRVHHEPAANLMLGKSLHYKTLLANLTISIACDALFAGFDKFSYIAIFNALCLVAFEL